MKDQDERMAGGQRVAIVTLGCKVVSQYESAALTGAFAMPWL